MYGSYTTIQDKPALRFERRLSHPIDVVWRAITEPDELEHWFPSKVQVDLREGGRMTFTFENYTLRGRVRDALHRATRHPRQGGPRRGGLARLLAPAPAVARRRRRTRGHRVNGEWRELYEEYQRRGAPADAEIPET